ncbi:uncharacterized protein LOC133456837 [Cololabis saira]|uniref:uncharacterized protein LOC133456837 n=1 Tax=Cololabis saira TaxID=129043 RepID=UPI002AD43B37|nr:uncharacterized protein LOC133456837 [Cololabis saira]
MATGLLLLLTSLASLAALAAASHHFGGTVSFTYKGTNADGTFQVAIRNRATYDGCQYNHNWFCYTGNCGNVSSSQKSTIDGSTNVTSYNSQWCETETVEMRAVSTNTPFQMRSASCCWIPTRNSVNHWRLNTLVDLGVRSDTGKPNSSPDIAILPFMRVPANCPRTYKLMSYDPDGDRVRCRYGNIPYVECVNCNLPQGFHLDQDSCTLHYRNASDNPRVFAFEMVVEDYPRGHMDLSYSDGSRTHKHPLLSRRKRSLLHQQLTTTSPTPSSSAPYVNSPPLSKLPLQFSLLVDPAAPSCQEGVFVPRFVSPTPENGEHIQAEVNKETEIRIRAVATHSTLQNIIISGPTNVSKSRNTHDEFVIRWTPTVDDLGDHYPVCFAVESSTG